MPDLNVPFKCPKCSKTLNVNARRAAPGTVLKCTGCGAEMKPQGDDLRKVQREIDDMMRRLQKAFARR